MILPISSSTPVCLKAHSTTDATPLSKKGIPLLFPVSIIDEYRYLVGEVTVYKD